MAKIKKRKNKRTGEQEEPEEEREPLLHPDTKKSVIAILLIGISVIFLLSSFGNAGPAGNTLYTAFHSLFGIGYYLIPAILFLAALVFLTTGRRRIYGITTVGSLLIIVSSLGAIDIVSNSKGGLLGILVGTIEIPFGYNAALVLLATALLAGMLLVVNAPIRIRLPGQGMQWLSRSTNRDADVLSEEETQAIDTAQADGAPTEEPANKEENEEAEEVEEDRQPARPLLQAIMGRSTQKHGHYVPPPISLLRTSIEKPTSGDLRAYANTIKRTLESFGIPVEMGEITIGPKVTRYALKPAEGVKLSRITTLNQDLALALAAHPIRIEAPIPGKSLVGIEVPNKTAAVVRLGTIMQTKEFQSSDPLSFILGRSVNGEPILADLAKMPHLLISGATGSGKSVMIHSLLLSLLYKNSPDMLRVIMVDPKKVELSVYEGIPHLIAPVVTENKKAIGAFRWALEEMDRRYELFMHAKSRDIKGYNAAHTDESLPYVLIVVDELADLMTSYGREVEGLIVRIAQMARAVGIHLVLSTQRPSVEVITGLIKANITSRIALQVASQIDSRTILDTAGAEKLLGGGDLLFISSQFSRPHRIQGALVTETEVSAVVDFIQTNNTTDTEEDIKFTATPERSKIFDDYANENEEDELTEEATAIVTETQKASASFLQRRMKIGYARAARLLDIMENRGIIGPSNGAKPRDVYVSNETASTEENQLDEE